MLLGPGDHLQPAEVAYGLRCRDCGCELSIMDICCDCYCRDCYLNRKQKEPEDV